MVPIDACSRATCASSAIVTLSRKRRGQRQADRGADQHGVVVMQEPGAEQGQPHRQQ
jgi:hypothetical protein